MSSKLHSAVTSDPNNADTRGSGGIGLAPDLSRSGPETAPTAGVAPRAFPACKQPLEHEEPSQLTTAKFVWVVLCWDELYLDRLGTAVSAWTASFIPSMKAKRHLSGFMALAIDSEDSYHHRIRKRYKLVQWKCCLLT